MVEQKREKTIIIWTMLWGILAHGYRLISVSIFGDSLFNIYNGYLCNDSGRWLGNYILKFIQILFGSLSELPFFSGIISLIFLVLCNIILIDLFEINKKENIIVASGILPTFTSLTVCFSFMYLSWLFMFAVFLSLLSLKLIIKSNSHNKRLYLYLGILLGVANLAIYQGFIGFTILGIFICFMKNISKKDNIKEIIYDGITYVLSLVIILLIYIIVNKFVLNCLGEPLTGYKNVNTLNSIKTVFNLKYGITNAYKNIFNPDFIGVFIDNSKYIYLYCLTLVIIYFIVKIVKYYITKNFKKAILVTIVALTSPLVLNVFLLSYMTEYYSDNIVFYYQSLILFIPIILSESKIKKIYKIIIIIPIIYSNLYFSYIANCNYYLNSIKEIRSEIWSREFISNIKQYEFYDETKTISLITTRGPIFFLDTQIEQLNYYNLTNYNNNSVFADAYLKYWIGWNVTFEKDEVKDKIKNTKLFEEMTYYPDKNAIKYFPEYNTIVVKFN